MAKRCFQCHFVHIIIISMWYVVWLLAVGLNMFISFIALVASAVREHHNGKLCRMVRGIVHCVSCGKCTYSEIQFIYKQFVL